MPTPRPGRSSFHPFLAVFLSRFARGALPAIAAAATLLAARSATAQQCCEGYAEDLYCVPCNSSADDGWPAGVDPNVDDGTLQPQYPQSPGGNIGADKA